MGVFPRDDTFAEFSTNYGERLASYIRHMPWYTTPDTTTGYLISTEAGDLHNGYSTLFNLAAFRSQSGTGTDTDMCSVLWRQVYLANVKTSLTFKAQVVSGAVTVDDFRFAGVCARVSGGTQSNTTGAQYVRDTTGYWLVLACNPALGGSFRYAWLLLRVNAGIISPLVSAFASAQVAQVMAGAHQMSLQVVDVAGNPVLTGYYDGVPIAGVTFTDSSGSKITAAGRCGFGLSRDRQLTSPTRSLATIASRFNVFDVNAGSMLLADDFTRVNTLANPTVTDGNGRTGKVLMSMWTLDIHGSTPWTAGSTQYRDAGFDRIDARGGIYNFSQIGAADQATQARSLVFRKTTNIGYTTATGILLRGVFASNGTASNGYLFTINYVNATYLAILRRFIGGAFATLATSDVSSGYGLAAGTDFRLLASVENVGAIPRLALSINDIFVQPWTLFGAGLTTTGGQVFDATGSAIQTGPAQAIQIIPFASTGDGHIYYRDWTDEEVPEDEVDDEANEPSMVLGSETDGKTGTHTMPIGSGFEVLDRARVAAQTYETRHVARVNFDSRTRRVWRVSVSGASQTERQALWDFWDDHGKSIPFDFTDPEGSGLIPAHFLDDSIETARSGPITSDFQYAVEELFSDETINAYVVPRRSIRVTGHPPSLTLSAPPSRAIQVQRYLPQLKFAFVTPTRAITVTRYPPTAP